MCNYNHILSIVLFLEMSKTLTDCFENTLIVKHSGGHYLPATAAQKKNYQEFLKVQLLQMEEDSSKQE